MEPTHRFPGLFDPSQEAPQPTVAVTEGESKPEPAREELRQIAADIVKYCPGLASMLLAFRSCPPYIGLN
jgi:hypothetical protein